jgi:sugar lactone lactonase YvrE
MVACSVLLVSSCTVPAPKPPEEAPTGPFFYPPAPTAPRIQHLLTLTNERDLGPVRSKFAEFVAGKETQPKGLLQPYGAALRDGKLHVVDTGAAAVVSFDLVARRVSLTQGAGAGRMKRPINLTIDTDGTRYITDTGLDQVMIYDPQGRFIRSFGAADQFRPTDVAIVDNSLFVVDILHHQVHIIDKQSGMPLGRFGKAGSGTGELFQPTNIAVAPGGDLLVTETGNFRVQRFKPDGTHVRFYGQAGNAPGSFARPKGIAVDRAGRIYVGDAAFQNVQIFEADGRLLMDFGRPVPGLEGLNLPASVRIDYEHAAQFQTYAAPGFAVEYLILVVSQFGPNKVDIYGFGRLAGANYDSPAVPGKSSP